MFPLPKHVKSFKSAFTLRLRNQSTRRRPESGLGEINEKLAEKSNGERRRNGAKEPPLVASSDLAVIKTKQDDYAKLSHSPSCVFGEIALAEDVCRELL